MDEVALILREVARTIVLPKFRSLAANEIAEKSAPGDFVTVADQDAEAAISAKLREVEDCPVLGEESVDDEPDLMSLVHTAGSLWIVDPIDGTGNFVRGSDRFALMVAYVRDGAVCSGWIYQPVPDLLFAADDGVATRNGVPFRRDPASPNLSELSVSASYKMPPAAYAAVRKHSAAFGRFGYGTQAAGWEYPCIAAGHRDVAIYRRTLPWDHAPGAAILRAAGGVVRRWDGTDYQIGDGKKGIVAACDEMTWRRVTDLVDLAAFAT